MQILAFSLACHPFWYRFRFLASTVKEQEHKSARADSEWPLEGICENCGALSDLLRVEGQLLCVDCRDEMY